MSDVVVCSGNHTGFQPDDEDWVCPRCGKRKLYVDEIEGGASWDCEKLHVDDVVRCEGCDLCSSGEEIVKMFFADGSRPLEAASDATNVSDSLLQAIDDLCLAAMQMTVSVPMEIGAEAKRVRECVERVHVEFSRLSKMGG